MEGITDAGCEHDKKCFRRFWNSHSRLGSKFFCSKWFVANRWNIWKL